MEDNSEHTGLSFDYNFLNKIIVGISEVSEITGIPTRQIRYWEQKKLITSLSEEGKNRRYDCINIKIMLLIKELLDEGYTLDAAGKKLKKRMDLIEQTLKKIIK